MIQRKYKWIQILGLVAVGFISLVLLLTLVFYLNRGWILNRVVTHINEMSPGEVQMGRINFIPFMDFPDMALQLRNVSYYESKVTPDSLYQEPILYIDEVFVSLDLIELIRKNIRVSEAKLEDGFVRMEVYENGISNLEYALGIRFNNSVERDSSKGMPAFRVDLDKIELSNIHAFYKDLERGDRISILLEHFQSRFSYLPDYIEAGVELDMQINLLKYLTYRSDITRKIQFESKVAVEPVEKRIQLAPSTLRFSGLEMETWGTYHYSEEQAVDLVFRASNKGLDVLNFLFMGILDLDEIEQIGGGGIYLNGTVSGSLKDQLPVIRLNGSADKIGFRIKSIGRDVTGISFDMFATNGSKLDMSEGLLTVEGFTANFPEGYVRGSFKASNMVSPQVKVELNGDLNLEGLERMFSIEALKELHGQVSVDGIVSGSIDYETGDFFEEEAVMNAALADVGLVLGEDTLDKVKGNLYLKENRLGVEDLIVEYRGNQLILNGEIENLVHFIMGSERDIAVQLSVSSENLRPALIFGDTSLLDITGEEIGEISCRAKGSITSQDLLTFIDSGAVPRVHVEFEAPGIRLPVYAGISDLSLSVDVGPDTLQLDHLFGQIGESRIVLSGMASNYLALGSKDSSGVIDLHWRLSSDKMRAEDLLTFRNEFLLPEPYRGEYLEDFNMEGYLALPASGFMQDSQLVDFGLGIRDMGWKFRYHPHTFDHFMLNMRKEGDRLFIDSLAGSVGDSNMKLSAMMGNINDTSRKNIYGRMILASDLLDFNEILNYQLPVEFMDTTRKADQDTVESTSLDQINYPQFSFTLDVDEIRIDDYRIFGLNGKLRSTREKIIYLDRLVTSSESGGKIVFNGQFNVSNPLLYNLSADFDIDHVDVNDLSFEMQSGDETYTLQENFRGLVSANGLAEVFITPDLKFDLANTTAVFNVKVDDGAMINFTPLQAAAKYLDNRDLNHVRFATLQNSFPLTLSDSKITLPLTIVESTIGQLLIEGEQGIDNSYLYLLRVPTWLVRDAARSVLSSREDEEGEDQIYEMKSGKFLMLTAWSDGTESEVRTGDRRNRYR